MQKKIKKPLLSALFILLFSPTAQAAYPTSYWQIGQVSEVLEFNYGDSTIASNVMAVYPDGSVVVNTYSPSDGGVDGQKLELDIGGDMGARHYCDEDGQNCFRPEDVGVGNLYFIDSNADFNGTYPSNPSDEERVYTANGQTVHIYDEDSDSWSTGSTQDGDRVFNIDGRVVQVYDGNSGTWEPTYTKNMSFYDYEFATLPNPESGDIVWNLDGGAHCCYDGTDWQLCNGNGACSRAQAVGEFDFACTGDVEATGTFYVGNYTEGSIDIPISNVTPGVVDIRINENGFYAERTVILQGGETGISIYPLGFYDDGAVAAEDVTFTITSSQADQGSCTGKADVLTPPASFSFICPNVLESDESYFVGIPSSGFINVPIVPPSEDGIATILIEGPEFSSTEEVLVRAPRVVEGRNIPGDTGIHLEIDYNGTGTTGWKEFSISSAEANGSCVGKAEVSDVDTGVAFSCVAGVPGFTNATFILGVPYEGRIILPIVNAVNGKTVELTVTDQDGFSFDHTVKFPTDASNFTAITIPDVVYDGGDIGDLPGTKTLTVTSAQADTAVACEIEIEVHEPTADAFTCIAGWPGETKQQYILGEPNMTPAILNLPIANPVPGAYVHLTIADQYGFTADYTTTFVDQDGNPISPTGIRINNLLYDGGDVGDTSGTKTLTITSSQATSAVPCIAEVEVSDTSGEFDFICPDPLTATGDFQFGEYGEGTIEIPVVSSKSGLITVNIAHNGFEASQSFEIDSDTESLLINPLTYEGSTGPGLVQFGITSPHADSGCVGEADIAEPTECSAGSRVFSGLKPSEELYELGALLDDQQTVSSVSSENYQLTRGVVELTGITGNCTADLECDGGSTEIVDGSETCLACPGGTISGASDTEGNLGVTPSYTYDPFDTGSTQSVTDVIPASQHGVTGVESLVCGADVTCNAMDSVSLSNESCSKTCSVGYSLDGDSFIPDNTSSEAVITSASSGSSTVTVATTVTSISVGDQVVIGIDADGIPTNGTSVLDSSHSLSETRTVTAVSGNQITLGAPLNQDHDNPSAGTPQAGDHYIAKLETQDDECIQANCDINTIITGENSGFGYNVNAQIEVGDNRIFDGPQVRDPVGQCLLRYRLRVDCNAPNSWTWEENDPTCNGDTQPPDGTGAGGGAGGGGNGNTGDGDNGTSRESDRCRGTSVAGSCYASWSAEEHKAIGETLKLRPLRPKNNQGCGSPCDAPDDCYVSAYTSCQGGGGVFGTASWSSPDEDVTPCVNAGQSRFSQVATGIALAYDLPAIGYVTPATGVEGAQTVGNALVTCTADFVCTGGTSPGNGNPNFKDGDGNESCKCSHQASPVSTPKGSYTVTELTYDGGPQNFTSDTVGPITNGTATHNADFECNNQGISDPQNEDCDPNTITCTNPNTHEPDPSGDCACTPIPPSPSGPGAFFDGPRIVNIAEFLVKLFK